MKRTAQSEAPRLSADLALSSDDIQYLPEYTRVDVTVHNLGSQPARGISVTLYDGDREIGRQRIPGIEAPLGFDPKTVRVGFRFTPARASHTFKVVVDSAVPEITKRNNTIVVERATPSAPPKQHATP
jgi:subtilase family serine protease